MHILLIHQAFAGIDEAGGTRHIEMAQRLVQLGHQVTIIASPVSYLTGKPRQSQKKWAERQEVQPGLVIHRVYTYSAIHRSFFHRVLSFFSFMFSSFFMGLRIKKVDLVWGTSPPLFQVVSAWLLSRVKRIPLLFEVRDLWPAFAIAIGVLRNRSLITISEWLESFLYRQANCVVVNSPGFITHVTACGAHHVELVPNGTDPEMFDPQDSGKDFRVQNGLDNKFVILYAGAHGLSNDLEVVINAAILLRAHKDIHFVLVGDGKEKPGLQSFAQTAGLENVLFLPPVPKNQMVKVLAGADACLAILKPLDLYRTTYPNKVFDYMAAGKPVLLAIDGVIREVIELSKAGVFVEPGNPNSLAQTVLDLSKIPQDARRMGENGRDYVIKFFNRRDQADKFILLIEELGRMYGRENLNR